MNSTESKTKSWPEAESSGIWITIPALCGLRQVTAPIGKPVLIPLTWAWVRQFST